MRLSSDDTRLSLASATLAFSGFRCLGVQDIGLTDELTGDPIWGNDSVAVGLPAGQHKAEGTLALLAEVSDGLRQNQGSNWGRVPGTLTVVLFEPLGAGLITHTATRCYMRKLEAKYGKPGGSDPGVETYGLIILDPINWNGAPMVVSPTIVLPGLNLSF